MTCSELERCLEGLLSGELGSEPRAACAEHLAGCADCRELVALASFAAPADELGSLAAGVLARTSGAACGAAEEQLCELVDGELQGADRALVDIHLEHCERCSALVKAMARLELDLPTLAELETDPTLVKRVLAATLPLEVRLRRWWRSAWPGVVRRPRFAVELAYFATAVLVVAITVPGSPLQAMPAQALELARRPPTQLLEEPVRQGLSALGETESARVLEEKWRTLNAARERAPELFEVSKERARTFFGDVASLLEKAAEDSTSEPAESTEETP